MMQKILAQIPTTTLKGVGPVRGVRTADRKTYVDEVCYLSKSQLAIHHMCTHVVEKGLWNWDVLNLSEISYLGKLTM